MLACLGLCSGCSLLFSSSQHTRGGAEDGGALIDTGVPTDSGTADTGADAGCDAVDDDGDGFSECQGDCDDGDATAYPDATPICDNGAVESCTRDQRAGMRAFFANADEVGVFRYEIPITGVSGTVEHALSLAATRGFSGSHAAQFFVALHTGTAAGTHGWIANPLVTEAPDHVTQLFGAETGPLVTLTLVGANDFDGRTTYAAGFDGTGSQLYASSFYNHYSTYSPAASTVAVTLGGTPEASASTAADLGSESILHAALVHSGASLNVMRFDALTNASSMLGVITPYRALVLRATSDGAMIAQSLPTPTDATWLDFGAGTVSTIHAPAAAPFVGPAAALSRTQTAIAFVTTGNAVQSGSMTCTVGDCTVQDGNEIEPAGDPITELQGVVAGTSTDRHGIAVASVRHGGTDDRIVVTLLDETLAPVAPGDAARITLPLPGRASALAIGSTEQSFYFAGVGGTVSNGYAVAVGVLVENGTDRSLVVSGLRACERR